MPLNSIRRLSKPWLYLQLRLFSFIFLFSSYLGAYERPIYVTNGLRADGFGMQFQTIIFSVLYAELSNRTFVYTPFKMMEHNYDRDPDFLKKKEELINFSAHFPLKKEWYVYSDIEKTHVARLRNYFKDHLTECANSESLKKIRRIFRMNKSRTDFFDSDHLHVAVHIRRRNLHDGTLTVYESPDTMYLGILERIRREHLSKNLLIHIYSQGDPQEFETIYGAADVRCHINDSIESTFSSLVFADVLVTSASSFSYTAALLSEGVVYYTPFSSPSLPGWLSIGN